MGWEGDDEPGLANYLGSLNPQLSLDGDTDPTRRPRPGSRWMESLGKWDSRDPEERDRDISEHCARIDRARENGLLYDEWIHEDGI